MFPYLVAQDSVGVATDGVLSGWAVSQTGTASASVVIGKGEGVAQDTVLAGAQMLVLDSDLTLDVLTANPVGGLPRNDMVVFDSATVSGGSGGVRVIVGTPNASPTDPTVPATAIPLARLRHAASATTVPTAKIDDLRVTTYLFGGPSPKTAAAKAGKRQHWGSIQPGDPVLAETSPSRTVPGSPRPLASPTRSALASLPRSAASPQPTRTSRCVSPRRAPPTWARSP